MNKDSRGYFYRSRRIGEKVVREYIGRGEVWEAVAQIEAVERHQRVEARRLENEKHERLARLDDEVETFCANVTAIMRAVLKQNGYRQHARGSWRKQRMTTLQKSTPGEEEETALANLVGDLMDKAPTDKNASAQLWKILDERGTSDKIARRIDVSRQAESSLFHSLTDDFSHHEANKRRIKQIESEVAGVDPTPLEELLAHRIAICWFHVYSCECAAAQNPKSLPLQKRLDHAHKRYLSAIKALAAVRKMQLPTMQFNIAEKQVNIAQGVPQGNT